MNVLDFFTDSEPDPWSGVVRQTGTSTFDEELLSKIRTGPLPGRTDAEAALALTELVRDEMEKYGTDSSQRLTNGQIGAAVVALRVAVGRLGIVYDPPFRDFSSFRSYWNRNEGYGSWQKRREMVEAIYGPLHLELIRAEEMTLDGIAVPVSPRSEVGWPLVDEEIRELRRRFQTATSPQDYRALGTNLVGVLEALSRIVYDPAVHLRPGEEVPPVDKSKQRIERYIETALPGPANEHLRGLAKKAIELAHSIKHSPASTRRDAGIGADAVILLANILKRLEQTI